MGFDAGRAGVAVTLEVDKQELKRRGSHERNMLLLLLCYRDVVPGARKDCKRCLGILSEYSVGPSKDCLSLSRGISMSMCCDMLGVPRYEALRSRSE